MEKIKALLETTRPINMLISFIGVVTGALLVSSDAGINATAVTAAFSAMLILAGGNALNDYYDVEADKVNRPKRPIPSGRAGKNEVMLFSATLFTAGIAAAFFTNTYCLSLALFNSLVLAAYAMHSKKAFLTSNLAVSYLSASVFLYGALSIHNTHVFNPGGLGILSILIASSFFMTLSREIVKDIEDLDGDAKAGATTLPTKIGIRKSMEIAIATGATSITISLIPLLKNLQGLDKTTYGLFITPANLIFISSYLKPPHEGQKRLILGMAISLIAFLAGRLAA
jgi:geranylgeranylglycerol-phosphate geranylgeranyltransferase